MRYYSEKWDSVSKWNVFVAECPLSSKMTTCGPKCKDDTECFGQKCCPNICNTKSCTTGNQLSSANTGYKDSKSNVEVLFSFTKFSVERVN